MTSDRPLTRPKADENVQRALEAVQCINQDEYYTKIVSRFLVFGQYVEDPGAEKVTLDIAVELRDKWPHRDLQHDMEMLEGFYCPKNYGAMHYWIAPRQETLRRMRFKSPYMNLYEIGTADDETIFGHGYREYEIPGVRFCYPEQYMAEALALRHRVNPTSDEALQYASRFDEFPSYKAMYGWLQEHPEAYVPIEEY